MPAFWLAGRRHLENQRPGHGSVAWTCGNVPALLARACVRLGSDTEFPDQNAVIQHAIQRYTVSCLQWQDGEEGDSSPRSVRVARTSSELSPAVSLNAAERAMNMDGAVSAHTRMAVRDCLLEEYEKTGLFRSLSRLDLLVGISRLRLPCFTIAYIALCLSSNNTVPMRRPKKEFALQPVYRNAFRAH